MSIKKLNDYLKKPDLPIKGGKALTPVLFSDSKGNYLERQIRPGISRVIKFWSEKGRTTKRGVQWLRDNIATKIGQLDNISIYVWLGTCDLTYYNYKTKYIELHPDPSEAIKDTVDNLNEIVKIVQNYPGCKVTLLEVPPISIYHWNKSRDHPDTNQFINQDCLLSKILVNGKDQNRFVDVDLIETRQIAQNAKERVTHLNNLMRERLEHHYEQLALPTCSNNTSSILADAGAVRDEEVYEAETCGVCENTIEDTADSCEICQNIAHSSCLVCSDGQTICFPCIDTIKRTSKIQVNSNIDEHQTYVKLGETPKEQQTNINGKPQSDTIKRTSKNHQQEPKRQIGKTKAISCPAEVRIDAPATKASKSKQDQTDTKTKDVRERELKLRKAEEQLKIKGKNSKRRSGKSDTA
ncbi:unnamed protein product [Mytilus edulis]|uniref:Uncharacterized protein n=1 Tax=Mytilus edulis TaxID=6550 RepID=A0A8S3QG47_MYTED|nr:unnamed protein product [Mytilus edulis]